MAKKKKDEPNGASIGNRYKEEIYIRGDRLFHSSFTPKPKEKK